MDLLSPFKIQHFRRNMRITYSGKWAVKASDALVLFSFSKRMNGNFPLTWKICSFTAIKLSAIRTEWVTLSKQDTVPYSLTHTKTIWTKHSDNSFKNPSILKQIARQDYTKWSIERVRDGQKIFESRQRVGNMYPFGIRLWLIFLHFSVFRYKTQEQVMHWVLKGAHGPTV